MKSINITLLLVFISVVTAFAQVPASLNYQAVVRNSSGEILANKTVSFRISLLQGSKTGAVVYSETHKLSTNDFGLVNLKIGKGTKLSGTFSPADWGDVIFTKVEIDPAGGSSFSELATSELSSVPFAFKAQTVENDKVDDADHDPTNEIQKLKLTGTLLELSDGGGSVTLPTSGSGGGDNWGAQVVKTDATLTGNGTSGNPLSVVGDGDGDDTNEIQTLSIKGQMLGISDGNTIEVPSAWSRNDPNIFRNNGNVGIGLSSPTDLLHLGDGNIRINNGKVILGEPSSDGAWSQFDTQGSDTYITNFSTGNIYFNTRTVLSATAPAYPRLKITSGGDVKVYNNLTVSKHITIEGGTPGDGKVLTSNANGLASWQNPIWTRVNKSDIKYSTGNVSIGPDDPEPYILLTVNPEKNDCLAIEAVNRSESKPTIYIVNQSSGPAAWFYGSINITDGTQGAGKVLTSDADGFASWQTPATGGSSLWTESGSNIYRNSGKVGIGTTSPTAPLEIKSNEVNALIIGSATANYNQRPGIQFKNNTSQFIAGDDASNEIFGFYSTWSSTRKYDARLRVYGNANGSWGKYIQLTHDGANGSITTDVGNIDITPAGNVGIKTDSPTATLDVNGSVRFRGITSGSQTTAIVIDSNGNLHSNSSDRRLKENIKPLDNSLDKILKLRGVSFTWKANPEYGTRIGFIAQEFEKVIPELSFTNPVDGYKGINYAEVTAVLVEAIKEQQKQIEKLESENNQLKADNNQFINANKQITKRLERLEQLISGYAVK